MDMIERVSIAVIGVLQNSNLPVGTIIPSEAIARAAIEAMREPTDEQRNAYYELSHRTEVMFDSHWERAIDAALSSSKPKTDVA